jgi:hypothetical protein
MGGHGTDNSNGSVAAVSDTGRRFHGWLRDCRSGQKATGYIVVPAGLDAASSIPVIVVNGAIILSLP